MRGSNRPIADIRCGDGRADCYHALSLRHLAILGLCAVAGLNRIVIQEGPVLAVLRRSTIAAMALLTSACGCGAAVPPLDVHDPRSPLLLERAIELPATQGRIDHLAVDVVRRRLYVAEVANGTVDAIDLDAGKVFGRIAGLKEPQGVAWLPQQNEFVVACGDGSVHFYDERQHEVARLVLGDDADNVRVDPRNGNVVVGYGSGGLATIDPNSHTLIGRLTFKGHPEGFRLSGALAFINVPGDGSILAVDRDKGVVIGRWSTGIRRLNFPMAIDPAGKSIVIAYRLPAALARIDVATGHMIASQSICGDSDDVFLDRDRVLVVCGAGHVDIVRDGRIETTVKTLPGARTGLFVPELHRLFVAVPARGKPAAIWELQVRGA